MRIKNSESRYGVVAITFHWIMALIMIGLLALGIYMSDLPDSDGKFQLFTIHKSFGLIILSLVFFRLAWRHINLQPGFVASRLEHVLVSAVKFLLYFSMIAMPLSGWLMSSAGGYEIHFFNWFVVPPLMAPNKALAGAFASFHEWAGYTLIGVIILHMLGAYKHHFYNKDDVLKRMIIPG